MTSNQIIHLAEGFEPFLAITALNILLTIWILARINRNHRDITAIKNLLSDIRRREVTITKPVVSSDEQDVRPAPQPEPAAIKANTDNSEIDRFLKALQDGMDIDVAAKQFHLTQDEARVAEISYRTAKRSEENSDPIS
jgi:hypothetical protein